jgi:hypothetical protein
MKFKSFTRRHPQCRLRDTPEAADSRPPRRPFNAHPLLWLAVAGHGYPVGSRLSRLGRQLGG